MLTFTPMGVLGRSEIILDVLYVSCSGVIRVRHALLNISQILFAKLYTPPCIL